MENKNVYRQSLHETQNRILNMKTYALLALLPSILQHLHNTKFFYFTKLRLSDKRLETLYTTLQYFEQCAQKRLPSVISKLLPFVIFVLLLVLSKWKR